MYSSIHLFNEFCMASRMHCSCMHIYFDLLNTASTKLLEQALATYNRNLSIWMAIKVGSLTAEQS